MSSKKSWVSVLQSIAIAFVLTLILHLVLRPIFLNREISEASDTLWFETIFTIAFYVFVVPIATLIGLLIQKLLSLANVVSPPKKAVIFVCVVAAIISIGLFIVIGQPYKDTYSENPVWLYRIRLLLIFLVASIVAIFVYRKREEKIIFDFNEDDTPLANTQEFNKLVAANHLTVIPTGDRTLNVINVKHGSAHFLADKVKEQATEKNPNKGLWIGGGFFHHKEGNLLTVAAPGSGKGAGLIIPNLLTERAYPHSLVVFDPKGTNAAITAKFQKQRGQRVIILDPSNIQSLNNAQHGIESACINPLDFVGNNLVKGCGQIASLLLPDDPKSNEKIWASEARDLIQGVLLHIMTSEKYTDKRNLVTLYKIFRQKTWEEILEEMIGNDACDGRVFETAKKLIDLKATNERGFGSVVFSTGEAINWLKDPDLQEALKRSDFNPADFDKGGITMYLCIPIDSVDLYATWGRLVIGLLLQANARPSGREKAWCYYLLDEFPTMGVFPEVIKALAFSREFKMRIWLFAQNLAQLDRIYTENQRKEILGTCGVFQAFSVNEPTTANYVSQRLGTSTVSGSFQNDSQRSLLFVNEVEKEKNIITFSEIGTYRLARWLYWKKPENLLEEKYYKMMSERAEKNVNYV